MCVAVPCQLIGREGAWGEVRLGGAALRVRLDLVDGVEVGDYLLVHAGFAIERLDAQEAAETLELLWGAGALAADDASPAGG